ncbi:HEAT repeat domain-containing protein [bacterium]|nr:HEAT repeat domain-containing protein [bacterium]
MKRFFLILLMISAFPLVAQSQTVTSVSADVKTVDEAWKWAQTELKSRINAPGSAWFVYSFQKEMCQQCFLGSYNGMNSSLSRRIDETITGQPSAEVSLEKQVRSTIQHIDNVQDVKVVKSIALIFEIKDGKIEDVALSTMDTVFDFGNRPIYWLGSVDPNDSQSFLMNLFASSSANSVKKTLVWAVGIHPANGEILRFLKTVAFTATEDEHVKASLFSLGSLGSTEAISVLGEFLASTASVELKKSALFALGNSELPEARRALVQFIRSESAEG